MRHFAVTPFWNSLYQFRQIIRHTRRAENNIRIYKPQRPAEVYSKLASENDIYITGMKTIQTSLEDYYMELKKRGGVQ